jgi:chromosome condensin MukBEF ATPase and DNA-binding subunit MukB
MIMRRKSRLAAGMLVSILVAGNVWAAMSKEAQEFMAIQSRMAPDQCELQRLSTQAAAAQRAGDFGRRQELNAQMEPVVKRLQSNQPRIQELSKYIQPSSPDYAAVTQQTMELRAKCKL